MSSKKLHLTWQAIRYLSIGAVAFGVDFALLYLMVSGLGSPAWVGAVVAFVISTGFSFFGQMRLTFGNTQEPTAALVRYLILLGANLAVIASVVELFDQLWDLYMVGKIFITVITTGWNFPIMRHWVYSGKPLLPRR